MTLRLPDGAFRAYLFDCDGTIADSMPIHFVAWQRILGEWVASFRSGRFMSGEGCR
jgi:beta-phosphoglucomutase-like phosphatase (HAD superfamily)